MERMFEVGARVRVVRVEKGDDAAADYVGCAGRVTDAFNGAITGRFAMYEVEFEDGDKCDLWHEELELIDAPADDNETILNVILDGVNAQLAKGRASYGQGVVVNDGHDWEIEALSEVFDGLVYTAARLIEMRRKREGESK